MQSSHRFPSFGRFECVLGLLKLSPKMAVFGPKVQFLKARSATCESRSRPPPLSFLLKLCVIVLHAHRYHPPKLHPNLNPHDGVLIVTHFARAAACCLLAACCCLLLLLLNLVGPPVTTKPTPDTVHSPTPGQLHVESIQLACTCALCCCYALCMKREELLIFYSFWLRCFVVMMQYVGFLG